jgi:hypothetical protein
MRGFGRYGRDYPPGHGPGWRAGGYGRDYGGAWRGYDRGYRRGYDRSWRRGYDRHLRGYDAPYGAGYPPYDATGWMPFTMAPLGFDPVLGWAGWGAGVGWVPPGPARGYDHEARRVPPRESPTYGRGGDRALRRWAERHGYDVEYTIQPRRGPRY